ncbi:MAG: hypothetical protein KDA96_22615, partial [Planctomycetaceae bacterium]|nr:hypothetical protein [Planctomycetaceae bacterium]
MSFQQTFQPLALRAVLLLSLAVTTCSSACAQRCMPIPGCPGRGMDFTHEPAPFLTRTFACD